MFYWLRRIFPSTHFLILVCCLYVASWLYPHTRSTLTQVFKPYQSQLAEWGNILVSMCFAFDVICIAIFIWKAAKTFLSWLIDLIQSRDDRYHELDVSWLASGGYVVYWAISILLFLHFIHINGPFVYWKSVFGPSVAKVIGYIPLLFKVISLLIGAFLIGGIIGAILIWGGWALYNRRAKIKRGVQTIYQRIRG